MHTMISECLLRLQLSLMLKNTAFCHELELFMGKFYENSMLTENALKGDWLKYKMYC